MFFADLEFHGDGDWAEKRFLPASLRARTPALESACAPHREAIELGLFRGRNAMAIWQDLVDTGGFIAAATRAFGASFPSCTPASHWKPVR